MVFGAFVFCFVLSYSIFLEICMFFICFILSYSVLSDIFVFCFILFNGIWHLSSLSVGHSRRHVGGPTNWDLA